MTENSACPLNGVKFELIVLYKLMLLFKAAARVQIRSMDDQLRMLSGSF